MTRGAAWSGGVPVAVTSEGGGLARGRRGVCQGMDGLHERVVPCVDLTAETKQVVRRSTGVWTHGGSPSPHVRPRWLLYLNSPGLLCCVVCAVMVM